MSRRFDEARGRGVSDQVPGRFLEARRWVVSDNREMFGRHDEARREHLSATGDMQGRFDQTPES
ncbi:hypothetical protein ACWEOI_24515 [Nocardia sp. NPDC004340]